MKPLGASELAIDPAPVRRSASAVCSVGSLSVALLRPAGLTPADRAHWAALSACAAPGNIFAADWFMAPAIRHCARDWSLRLAVVREASGVWLGVLPLTQEAQIGRWPVPTFHSWKAANQFIGTPLVRAGAERAFWQALLDHLDRHPGLVLGLCCDTLPLDDPAHLALVSLCAEQRRALHTCHSFTRPAQLASPAPDPAARRKLDKRLDTLARKLAQAHGPVRLVRHDHPEDCEPWLAAFLALERAGWKGRAASALACQAATASLFRDVIRRSQRAGAARLVSLSAGEKIVAMSSWFVADGHGYGFKMAFDESLRAFAPGRLLMREVAGIAQGEGLRLFDTCAAPDAPGDPLWPDRRAFATQAVAIGGRARQAVFDRLMRARRLAR
ncbi:GNAT family N-acetyltransferase [Erythrobacter sp. BLCC-B19]|uniref:GNAT family N-acetyltransferase n=1 Tax=Erythrobacter sp. BLCC-B19 TaxID=3025315 RepID=UPI00235F2882|nr:GNAT family N-acetyltransferase [Erythrobacter sp. BLCC-B19]WDA42713.1 GNAT family N-acetyltransferase [Erythrobacter sp. BLCC-B19]